jgi:DNA-directed RNA polymerase subunit M/transcription elongation factor TFIIS
VRPVVRALTACQACPWPSQTKDTDRVEGRQGSLAHIAASCTMRVNAPDLHGRETRAMEQQTPPSRTCPACGSSDYQFRSRKKVGAEAGTEEIETKYRCKACGKEWRVRVPG